MKIAIEEIWNAGLIEKARDELRSQDQVIDKAIQKANQAAVDAETEIKDLKEKILPGLLVEQVFGKKVLKIKIEKIKERRAELQEIIDDLPLLLKGFEVEKKKIDHWYHEVERRERYVQRYEKTKTALKGKYSSALEQTLLHQGKILTCEADAQEFLKILRESRVKS